MRIAEGRKPKAERQNQPLAVRRWALGIWLLVLSPQLSALSLAKTSTSPHFSIETSIPADQERLPEIFKILEQAYRDLLRMGYKPPTRVKVVVHGNLESFQGSTRLPWFVLASADQKHSRIDTQRLRIVAEKGLEATLRHELFHLAQPGGWPRWKAEGMAMRFAGQRPTARPLEGLSEARLNRLLTHPPDQETLSRAMATAFERAQKTR